MFKMCGNGEDGQGISLIYPYLYLLLSARWRRLCVHGVNFYPTEGFNSMKSWGDSCGTVVFYVNQVRDFLKYTLRNHGGAQVRCLGCVCRWTEVDSVEVSRQGSDPCWCGMWRFDVMQYLWGDTGMCIA